MNESITTDGRFDRAKGDALIMKLRDATDARLRKLQQELRAEFAPAGKTSVQERGLMLTGISLALRAHADAAADIALLCTSGVAG